MPDDDGIDRDDTSARRTFQDASDGLKRQARTAVEEAQRTAATYAEDGMNTAASHLSDFARAVRSASDELAERDQGVAARVVTEAADGLERVASSVSGASADELMGSVQTFARRNPGAFMIGAVLAGVALGHLAKTTSRAGGARARQALPPRAEPSTAAADTTEPPAPTDTTER